jgi:hypothetical protein
MNAGYSDKQIVPDSEYAGLQHHKKEDVIGSNAPEIDTMKEHHEAPASQKVQRICGIAAKTFWIVIAVIIVVIVAAAVGGGVGASASSKKHRKASSASSTVLSSPQSFTAASSSSQSADHITSSPTTTIAVTTTQVVGPSTTLLRDCPSSNNTIYDVTLGSSQKMSFRKICNASFLSNKVNAVNTASTDLNGCINLCAAFNIQNKTDIAAGTTSPCNAVCWRNTFINDDHPGICFGFTTTNSSGAFVWQQDTVCDGAAWINQSF